MTVIAWIVEGTWPACVDAARTWAPEDAGITLLHVTGPEVPGAARGAYAGLLGRARPDRDPGTRLEHLAAASAGQLLAAAAARLGRPCTRVERAGRAEREVVAAAEGGSLLILARDGDRWPAPQPGAGQPFHRRPRPLSRPAGLARIRAQRGHHPAAATPPAAPPVEVPRAFRTAIH